MSQLYVLEEDQVVAQLLYQTIVAKRKELITHNVDALHNTLAGNYLETVECDSKAAVVQGELIKAYHELDRLQAKRINRENFERIIKQLSVNGTISIVRVERRKA